MKQLTIVVTIGVACFLLVACSEKSPVTTGKVEQSESNAPAQMAASAPEEPAEIDGTLTQTDKGLAIVTDTDIYVVAGEDLSDMLGKKVTVTGAIAEVGDTQVIRVMSVIPIE